MTFAVYKIQLDGMSVYIVTVVSSAIVCYLQAIVSDKPSVACPISQLLPPIARTTEPECWFSDRAASCTPMVVE